jgi:tetratricopeptide (TPR) repeat protein
MPTLIDLAGAGQPACQLPGPIDGVSVASLFSRNTSPGLEAYGETFLPRDQFGWSELRSIRTEELKYIEAPQPEMYDVKADPGERTNAIASRQEEATRLKRVLDALTRATSAPPRRTASDPMMSERLMSLGYIGYSPSFQSSAIAVLADPKSKLEVYNRTMVALELSEAGDVAGALRELDAAERIDPDVAQVAFLKGNLFGRIDRFQDAEKALRRTVALNPQFVAARFKLALALLRSGRPDEAVIALERVVQDEPGDFRAWHNLAAVAYSRSDLDRAEQFERKALAINPDYGEAWNTLGAIHILRRRPELAVDALTRATSLSPRNPQAFRNLSLALRAAGQPERAGAAASTACTIDPRFCERTAPR